MSNTIEFPGNENGKKISRSEEYRHRSHELRLKLAIALAVVCVLLVLLYYKMEQSRVFSNIEKKNSIKFSSPLVSQTMAIEDNILTCSRDGANCMDAQGNLLWNMTFEMQNPLCSVCKGTAAFADYGSGKIYIHAGNGSEAEINTTMPIRKIAVAENGVVAAVLEDVDITWIYIYDMNQTTIAYFRTSMQKSGYPLDIDISPSGELVAVSYYFVDNSTTRSSVAFYNFGDVGQNNIDNYVSGFNYADVLVPEVCFMDDDSAYAISTSRFSMYEGAHKPVSVAESIISDDIISVYNNDKYVAVICRNKSGNTRYRLDLYGAQGKLLTQNDFDFDFTGVALCRDGYALYGNSDIYIASDDGKKRYEGKYTTPILKVVPTDSIAKYYFVTENTVDTVVFK